ncbi:hypothetical protein SANTM175S_08352 [Streptomyces antimycoticus]
MTTGLSTTSVKRPLCPAASSMTPVATSSYAVILTPSRAHTDRYVSMWHCESETSRNSSGFQHPGSPRNAGSALPRRVGLPPPRMSCDRS